MPIANVMAFTGGQGATNTGNAFIALKPLDDRPGKVSVTQVIDRLRPKLAQVPGGAMFLQATQDIRMGGRGASAQYQYTLKAETPADLLKYGPPFLSALKKAPGVTDANTDQQNNGLQALLKLRSPNRPRASGPRHSQLIQPSTTPSGKLRSRPSTAS